MVYVLLELLHRAGPARKRASEWIPGLRHWMSAMPFVEDEVAQRNGIWDVAQGWYPFGRVEDHFEEWLAVGNLRQRCESLQGTKQMRNEMREGKIGKLNTKHEENDQQ
jgi:hypothetical protein